MQNARLRFEVLFALGWLLFGALVLPAIIYVVGGVVFGRYEGGPGAFYSNLYSDLIAGSGRAVGLVFGPYVIMMLARLPFIGLRKTAEDEPPATEARPRKMPAAPPSRVEPKLGPE